MDIIYKVTALEELLKKLVSHHSGITFSSSLSAEDMLILDVIEKHNLPISVFTLDTGRLPKETYELLQLVQASYKTPMRIYVPESLDLENYVNQFGCNAFYESVDYRKLCCKVRKIGPLRRALKGNNLWITGLRREQSVTRQHMELIEYDEQFNIQKCNPLMGWSVGEVWQYIRLHDVPYNALHDKGYPSIGCAPCTRPVEVFEDERAGRWWWENPETKECGLHIAKAQGV
ncbi:MAG: phosphoadenylyl-sulfate reductase [Gammaproteobacteria bacterium]|nr:phosphoadenylyl-sulfate reductase [Gammaproteobacteria bacterium]